MTLLKVNLTVADIKDREVNEIQDKEFKRTIIKNDQSK
jgi:hypothetical protein